MIEATDRDLIRALALSLCAGRDLNEPCERLCDQCLEEAQCLLLDGEDKAG